MSYHFAETTKNLTATNTKVVDLNTILYGDNQINILNYRKLEIELMHYWFSGTKQNLEATSKDLTVTKTKLDTLSKNLISND